MKTNYFPFLFLNDISPVKDKGQYSPLNMLFLPTWLFLLSDEIFTFYFPCVFPISSLNCNIFLILRFDCSVLYPKEIFFQCNIYSVNYRLGLDLKPQSQDADLSLRGQSYQVLCYILGLENKSVLSVGPLMVFAFLLLLKS
jgi:hypothetical protein